MRKVVSVAVLLACGLGASAARAASPLTEAYAEQKLNEYVRMWSSNGRVSPATVSRYYAGTVIYYGKPMSQRGVLRDKLQYSATWPERHYRIVPGTVSVACDPYKTACRVTGVMEYDRRSVAGQRAVGAARLSLTLSRDSGSRVVQESAVFLR